MNHSTIVTSRTSWFLRGIIVGVLVAGALNAISYFFQSDGFGNLLATTPDRTEAIGFPLVVWEQDSIYGSNGVDFSRYLVNVLFAVLLGIVGGFFCLALRRQFNELVKHFEPPPPETRRNFRFSLRGLLAMMAIVAVSTAGARSVLTGRAEVMWVIYVMGPWFLLGIALIPRRIPWQQRVMILVPSAVTLIVGALWAGASLDPPVELDQVILGIYVCWTPQTVLAAVGVTLAILVRGGQSKRRNTTAKKNESTHC